MDDARIAEALLVLDEVQERLAAEPAAYDDLLDRDFELCLVGDAGLRLCAHSECEATWEEWEVRDPTRPDGWREVPHYQEAEALHALFAAFDRHFGAAQPVALSRPPASGLWEAVVGTGAARAATRNRALMRAGLQHKRALVAAGAAVPLPSIAGRTPLATG